METFVENGVDPIEGFYIAWILRDILLNRVRAKTVRYARRIEHYDFDFIDVLAGAPEEVDYQELRELAKEELTRYLLLEGENGDNGN